MNSSLDGDARGPTNNGLDAVAAATRSYIFNLPLLCNGSSGKFAQTQEWLINGAVQVGSETSLMGMSMKQTVGQDEARSRGRKEAGSESRTTMTTLGR